VVEPKNDALRKSREEMEVVTVVVARGGCHYAGREASRNRHAAHNPGEWRQSRAPHAISGGMFAGPRRLTGSASSLIARPSCQDLLGPFRGWSSAMRSRSRGEQRAAAVVQAGDGAAQRAAAGGNDRGL
jgi:hypothetical protein